MEDQIAIYKSPEGIEVAIVFSEDTVWATQRQMAELFNTTPQNITLHLKRIYEEGEIAESATCKEYLQVQKEGKRNVKRRQLIYNLDAILSVGYRISSVRGTQFRQWATQRLKDYLVQGYAINEKRLAEKQQQVEYLKTGIRILNRAITQQATEADSQMLQIFAKGLELLDDYDHEKLDVKGKTIRQTVYPDVKAYLAVISQMKSAIASDLFAKPKDKGFESSIKQIAQSFGNEELYKSIEEKAATLLYLIVKNHSFVDGNKRIAAACFLHFLEKNDLLYAEDQSPIISNEALAALTLFVATSKPEEMETVKQLIISILNRSKLKM
ncbi:MAG: type II toxin-antitoxin system death-on-curing family toxin [Bacteroidales bacterium]|nr:type II toxin-antitoxin system death-on-curing family toxin [Bacteroidales bacterium]